MYIFFNLGFQNNLSAKVTDGNFNFPPIESCWLPKCCFCFFFFIFKFEDKQFCLKYLVQESIFFCFHDTSNCCCCVLIFTKVNVFPTFQTSVIMSHVFHLFQFDSRIIIPGCKCLNLGHLSTFHIAFGNFTILSQLCHTQVRMVLVAELTSTSSRALSG